jgi:hypothetical protein
VAKQNIDVRDWFAGRALQGLLAGPSAPKKSKAEYSEQYAARVAGEAYAFAHAMLQVRAKPTVAPQNSEEA